MLSLIWLLGHFISSQNKYLKGVPNLLNLWILSVKNIKDINFRVPTIVFLYFCSIEIFFLNKKNIEPTAIKLVAIKLASLIILLQIQHSLRSSHDKNNKTRCALGINSIIQLLDNNSWILLYRPEDEEDMIQY